MGKNSYRTSKIYKLYSSNTPDVCIYVTYGRIKNNLAVYQSLYKKYKAKKSTVYYKCFTLFDFGNVNVQLLENFSCDNKQELEARKRYWKRNHNKKPQRQFVPKRPGVSKRKRRVTCDCGVKYTQGYKAQHEKSKRHREYIE